MQKYDGYIVRRFSFNKTNDGPTMNNLRIALLSLILAPLSLNVTAVYAEDEGNAQTQVCEDGQPCPAEEELPSDEELEETCD